MPPVVWSAGGKIQHHVRRCKIIMFCNYASMQWR